VLSSFTGIFLLCFIPNLHPTSLIVQTVQVLDFITFGIMVAYDVKNLNFYFCLMMILAIGLNYELQHLNQFIRLAVFNLNHTRYAFQCRLLAVYREWHLQISRLVIHLNENLISIFFYGFVISNTIFNVSVIMFVLYKQMQRLFRIFLIILFCIQIAVSINALSTLIPVNYALYRTNRDFYALFSRLKANSRVQSIFREQWKSTIHYELLYRKKKKPLAICVGPLGTLNRKSLFQVNSDTRN